MAFVAALSAPPVSRPPAALQPDDVRGTYAQINRIGTTAHPAAAISRRSFLGDATKAAAHLRRPRFCASAGPSSPLDVRASARPPLGNIGEHYDAHQLHTDSVYRFSYLSKFMKFTDEDIATIKASAPILGPLVPTLVDSVYNKLASIDVTRKYFIPEGDSAALRVSVEKRKEMLSKYLVTLVTCDYDGTMVEFIDQVGRVHSHKGGNPNLEVDLVHVSATFGFVNDALIATFESLDPSVVDLPTKFKLVRAFTKLLWIQSDFFSRYYTRCDSEA